MPTASDADGVDRVLDAMKSAPDGLIFANLVDFDTVYGHRNDVAGYAANIERFDERLGSVLDQLRDTDLLVITADHGNDPTTPSTDHSREHVPLLLTGRRVKRGADLGTRSSHSPTSGRRSPPTSRSDRWRTASAFWRTSLSSIREALEQRERETLAPQAARSADSRGRLHPEPEDDVRPAFQHDRDRIIHSKAFRRLKHKTQVFFAPAGDHYRTRLTHSLEVSQIARTIAKVLQLHEELTESIALGHDLGHTPFGHAGERVLDSLVPGGFRHYEQSLRIVDVLENDGRGLNLTWEVRDGIGRHSKGKDGSPVGIEPSKRAATLEGQVMRVADLIAYVNHDIDDAVRAGVLKEAELPKDAVGVLGLDLVGPHRLHGEGRRHRNAGRRAQRDSHEPRRARCDAGHAGVSVRRGVRERDRDGRVQEGHRHSGRSVGTCARAPGRSARPRIVETEGLDVAAKDFLAGMTDRFAVALYERLFIPKPWVGPMAWSQL